MAVAAKVRTGLLLAAACTLGILIRIAIPGVDFLGPTPIPFPDDPPYHLLRVERLIGTAHPVDSMGRPMSPGTVDAVDPMIAHPFGDRCIWPWGFDWLAAAMIPDGACGRTCVAWVAGAVPVAFSLITALLVFLLAARLARGRGWGSGAVAGNPDYVAVAAAALFLLMPANVAYTMAGRFDHHVMEPLFVALPLTLAATGARRGFRHLLAGGLFCGLGAAFFPAAPAISFPVFVIVGAFLSSPVDLAGWCAGMLAGLTLSLFASPMPLEWVHYSPSVWHLTAAACLSMGLIGFRVTTAFACRRKLSRLPATLIGTTAGITAMTGAVAVTCIFFPAWLQALADGLRYASSSGFAALSLEASSFLEDPPRMLGLTGWLVIPGLAGLFAAALPSPSGTIRPATGAFIVTTAALVCLAAAQRRFLVASTPLIAVSAAFGLDFIAATLVRGHTRPAERGRILAAAAGTVVLMALSLSSIADMDYLTPRDRAMYAAADAIAGSGGGERGTLAPWGYGHIFKYAGGAPTVCDNFFGVPGADAAMHRCLSLLYDTDPESISRELRDLKIRFVVLAPPHPDQVRAETALIGQEPAGWVDGQNRLSPKFAASFTGRVGMWASTAPIGETGPFNLALRGRFRQVNPSTGQVEAEVLLLENQAAEPH